MDVTSSQLFQYVGAVLLGWPSSVLKLGCKLISVVLPVTSGVAGQLCHHIQFGSRILLFCVYYSLSVYFSDMFF
jgi:hypothetical protein